MSVCVFVCVFIFEVPFKSNSEYWVRNPVQAVLQSNKILKAKHCCKIFLALHDPETQGVQELILSLF